MAKSPARPGKAADHLQKNHAVYLNGDEVDREKWDHHDRPLRLLRKPHLRRVFSQSLLDGLNDGSRLLLDVGDVVEEAARDVSAHTQITDGVDEGQFEVDHQSNWPLEHSHPPRAGDVFNEVDQALVDAGVLSSHKAVEERI